MTRFPLVALDATADALHAASADPWWREAWYFEVYDPQSRLQFHAYQGVFPNQGLGDLTAAFFHEGELLHEEMKMDFTVGPAPLEERLHFGPMKLEMLQPFERWRIRYDRPAVLADLEFQALHAPYSWAESRLALETSPPEQSSHHFDQFGRYRGTVSAGKRSLAVDALGFRDRMWGWGGRKHWVSYIVFWAGFGEDLVANVSIQDFADGSRGLCGYIHQDGQRALLAHAEVRFEWDERRWRTIARAAVRAEDALGRRIEFTGRPMGISDTSHRWKHRQDHMLFSLGEYRAGRRVGHGVMNWAFIDAAHRPDRMQAVLPQVAAAADKERR